MFTLNSRDLRILHDVGFNDFIKDDFIPEGDGQVTSDSVSLPHPVSLETEDQTFERDQKECDVLETLGEYKCDTGRSVENVSDVVNTKTLKERFIAHQFSTGWSVGVVKRVETEESVVKRVETEESVTKSKHC